MRLDLSFGNLLKIATKWYDMCIPFPGRSIYHAAGLLSFMLHFQLARTRPSVSRDCVRTSGVPDLLILHVLCSNGACWLTLPGCSTANFPTADEVRMSTDRRGPIAATLCQFSHVKYGSVLCQNQRCLDRYTGLQKLWIYPLFFVAFDIQSGHQDDFTAARRSGKICPCRVFFSAIRHF